MRNKPREDAESEDDSEDDEKLNGRTAPAMELVDIGGVDNEEMNVDTEEAPIGEISSFPLSDVMRTLRRPRTGPRWLRRHTQRRRRAMWQQLA